MKTHLLIIIAIVIGFTTFMLGYSLPPFMEVGFGDSQQAATTGGDPNAELLKQYEKLYKQADE